MPIIDKITYDGTSYEIADRTDLPRIFPKDNEVYGKIDRIDEVNQQRHYTQLSLYDRYWGNNYTRDQGFNNGTSTGANAIYFYRNTTAEEKAVNPNDTSSVKATSRLVTFVDHLYTKGNISTLVGAYGIDDGQNNFWLGRTSGEIDKDRNSATFGKIINCRNFYGMTNPTAFRRDARDSKTFNFKENKQYWDISFTNGVSAPNQINTGCGTIWLTPGNWIVTATVGFSKEDSNNINHTGVRLVKITKIPPSKKDTNNADKIIEMEDENKNPLYTYDGGNNVYDANGNINTNAQQNSRDTTPPGASAGAPSHNTATYVSTTRLITVPKPEDPEFWGAAVPIQVVGWQNSGKGLNLRGYISAMMV